MVSRCVTVVSCIVFKDTGVKKIYTHDDSFWNDDPVDKDHSRKKRILHDARIEVDAPFHPAFKPTEQIMVPKRKSSKKPVARASNSVGDLFENKK